MFSRRGLERPNVGRRWIQARAWELWEEPWNIIAGESHYQDGLLAAAGMSMPTEYGVLKPVVVTFRREPYNQYDGNAIQAFVDGHLVGYLRRHLALQIAARCDTTRCTTFRMCGILRGGVKDEAEWIGCHLWHGRRLTSAPAIVLSTEDEQWAVQWPPTARETNE